MTPLTNSPEVNVSSIATASSVGGGGIAAIFGGLSSNEVVAYSGLGIAILSFFVNAYFQKRKDARETALINAKIAALAAVPPKE